MDFSFHIQQGQQLLDKQDANSVNNNNTHNNTTTTTTTHNTT